MRETIAAIATAAGVGGVGIVRVSGPQAGEIARALLGKHPAPRHAHYCRWHDRDGELIDQGLLLYFPAPHSYTGEDVLELQGHGGPIVLGMLLARVFELGARPARPGEFSERAFLEGRLDLTQAEAIADLIAAGSTRAARAALRSLDGAFSDRVEVLLAELTALRVLLEAAIDFPDEEIDILTEGDVANRLQQLQLQIAELRMEAARGQRLRDGLYLVILGPPNAGKSSLLNALAGSDRAIVTAIPGTTRDVLRESLTLRGVPVTVVDTAGLRESSDPIETEGVRRAGLEAQRADHALIVLDDSDPQTSAEPFLRQLPAGLAVTIVRNKVDVSGRLPGAVIVAGSGNKGPGLRAQGPAEAAVSRPLTALQDPGPKAQGPAEPALPGPWALSRGPSLSPGPSVSPQPSALSPEFDLSPEFAISATQHHGLSELIDHLVGQDSGEGSFSARARHLAALERVDDHLHRASKALAGSLGAELVAEDLRLAQEALAEITGRFNADDLLGEIFGSFCIGK